MPIKKNIKISAAKRGHHERRKKNFLKSKKQLHREQQIKTDVFEKSKNEKRKKMLQTGVGGKYKRKQPTDKPDGNKNNSFLKPIDIYDMLEDSSDENSSDQYLNKRPKIDVSDEEVLVEDSDTNNESDDELNDEKLEEIELTQQKFLKETKSRENVKQLLPIKTKSGLKLRQTIEVFKEAPNKVSPSEDSPSISIKQKATKENDLKTDKKNVSSAAELLIRMERELELQKFRIGKISSGITENPEEKIGNLRQLLNLLQEFGENEQKNLLSVRKIAMFSMTEIFKDITPDYKIGIVDLENQKVKKDTLARVTYENELLKYYKKFLRELESISKAIKPGKFSKRPNKQNIYIAESAIYCMCEILIHHPYFNFNTNVAQLLVIYLNCSNSKCRKMINETFIKIFKTDKRLDLTLHIVRNINHLVKKKSYAVYSEVVSCLLALQIKNINVDAEKEAELKQKKLEQHKSRLISMSKRERKRKNKLSELDKELMETQAEENKQTKHAKLTDISKLVFTIYFRILKENPRSKVLNFTLEGLAKFSHIINIDFFSDLINVLNSLIENADLGYREQLFCIQTVFSILSGQGEALNIDAVRFYVHLYRNMFCVSAGKNHKDIESIIETMENILIKRRKSMTQVRYLAFLKRLMTLSIQLLHNGSLGCLALIKNAMQLNPNLDVLIDTENQIGSGKFNPFIDDPEFSNANCSSLFELQLLKNHYHPIVVRFANHISKGCPIGNQDLEPQMAKMAPLDFFNKFDSSLMTFNPPIPCPSKETIPKITLLNLDKNSFKLNDLNNICSSSLEKLLSTKNTSKLNFNFFTEYHK